jgi:hypothetical protein
MREAFTSSARPTPDEPQELQASAAGYFPRSQEISLPGFALNDSQCAAIRDLAPRCGVITAAADFGVDRSKASGRRGSARRGKLEESHGREEAARGPGSSPEGVPALDRRTRSEPGGDHCFVSRREERGLIHGAPGRLDGARSTSAGEPPEQSARRTRRGTSVGCPIA